MRPPLTYNRHQLYTVLGRGDCAALGVGHKAALLDRALRVGLPVPSGAVLLDEAWQYALEHGLVTVHGERVTTAAPQRLLSALHLPTLIEALYLNRPDYPLAVRSAFSAEDRTDLSLAGYFTSCLHVNPADPAALANALCAVWSSALAHPGNFRRDVLIMEMVNARHAGVLFSEPAYQDDLVNYTTGTAEALLTGRDPGQRYLLPRRQSWEPLHLPADAPPFAAHLQRLLPNVRAVFGDDNWDIEWADDGTNCWLLQIRPITRPTRRDEAFTNANFKELFPDLPSQFMTTLVASCAEGLFEYYRRFDRRLPTDRALIEIFRGRPYFNITLLTDLMRAWGLPTRLVTSNIGGQADREVGFRPLRFFRKTFTLLHQGWDQLTAPFAARRTMRRLLQRTATPPATFTDAVELLRWVYTTTVTQMFSLTAAMSAPLLLLRLTGTLTEHNARQRAISTEIYTDLDPLRRLAAAHPHWASTLQASDLPDHPEFQRLWQAYLAKHGVRGTYESDIARPRYHEAPAVLLASLTRPAPPRSAPPPRTFLGLLTLPIWWQARRSLNAREGIRYHTMLAFDRLRARLLALAEQAVAHGQLPEVTALWDLNIAEAAALDHGHPLDTAFWQRRHAERARLTEYALPDLIHRFDDLEQYRQTANTPATTDQPQRWHGLSLTPGELSGIAWVLPEPTATLPSGFDPATTILVAPSIDAGWIPTFSLVAGVVVETGGDLSHGSIILREIGLPAITNVKGITRQLTTGDTLTLYADSGTLTRP